MLSKKPWKLKTFDSLKNRVILQNMNYENKFVQDTAYDYAVAIKNAYRLKRKGISNDHFYWIGYFSRQAKEAAKINPKLYAYFSRMALSLD